jgi:hypothetical protein
MDERPTADRMIVAELTGEARRHARWELPDEETVEAAVAELRKIAGGRTDLLAEVAGLFLGTSEGEPHEPRARNAAELCHLAGADPELISWWVDEGRRRTAQARKRPFGIV